MKESASMFQSQATRLKRKLWWQNVKLWLILITIILIILVIIVSESVVLRYCLSYIPAGLFSDGKTILLLKVSSLHINLIPT